MEAEQLKRQRIRAGRITVVLVGCLAGFVVAVLAFQGAI